VIESPESVLVAPDGELAGRLPVTVDILPKAIRLVTGPDPPLSAEV